MVKQGIGTAAVLLLLILAAPAARAWECAHGTPSTGDSAKLVKHKCGKPDFTYATLGYYRRGRFTAVDEVWYYNAGPRQLLRALHFHKRKLEAIETPGYGFDTAAAQRCTPQDLRTGLTVYQLLARCGKPTRQRDRSTSLHGKRASTEVMLRREEWVYELGPQYLPQQVTLNGDRVEAVEPLSRRPRRSKHRK